MLINEINKYIDTIITHTELHLKKPRNRNIYAYHINICFCKKWQLNPIGDIVRVADHSTNGAVK